jgi:hypothetical protein
LSIAVPKHENHRNEILITSSEEGEKWQQMLGRVERQLVSSKLKRSRSSTTTINCTAAHDVVVKLIKQVAMIC